MFTEKQGTNNKLQRYCQGHRVFKASTVKIIEILNKYIPGIEAQNPTMSYPNLMAQCLTRGGLTTISPLDLELFCSIELCIRPFLNIAHFRDSTTKSDAEMVEQLVEHNFELFARNCPYIDQLDRESSMLLFRLIISLFYRVRKWAYVKVYKERKKVNESLATCHTSKRVDLHGKDSIRKALMGSGPASGND